MIGMKVIKGRKKRKFKNKIRVIILIMILLPMFSGVFLLYGPYDGFRNFWITTAMTTMNHQYLATWFFSDETINKVLSNNKIIESSESTNLDLISNGLLDTTKYKDKYDEEVLKHDKGDIYKLIQIKEGKFSGYMAVIYDASKIKLAVSKNLGYSGEYLVDMAKDNKAVVAINGGGFVDIEGKSNGGRAQGILIKDEKILQSSRYRDKGGGVIGFTRDNKLYLGNVSAEEAVKSGVRDAVEFGPYLIVNGVSSSVVGNGGYGIHPRSAIGQRKDGIVLFLVIDGRSASSMGCDMDDLIRLMERYGAYNAANLDGGNSSVLVIKNKIVNHPINWDNLEQTRPIADGFVVIK